MALLYHSNGKMNYVHNIEQTEYAATSFEEILFKLKILRKLEE